ncbi:MAG: insulinase family protein [Bacteroidales bacterium]|nr:insulinase family protein [Bacteroidales bacterium]
MKKFLTLALLCLFVATGALFAQVPGMTGEKKQKKSDLSATVPIDKNVRKVRMDNGMTYYLRVNKKPEGRIQFRLVTNAGSILEDDSQQGLAHFCEHMAFNGTEHYPHNTMIAELQKNGVAFGSHVNAYTSFDETVYFINMPNTPEMIEMGLKILDGWASKLLFDQKEIEAERGVIHEEWRGSLGANDRLRKIVWPIMLKGSKYADRLPIGTEEVIMNFKRDEIVRFYKDWYRTDLQAVIIVGDFDMDQMEAKVKQYFEGYKAATNPKERTYFPIPDNKEPLIAIATDKEAPSTTLELMWKHKKAPQGTIGDYRQSLVRQLANGMIASRFAELCEKASAPVIQAYGYYGGFLGRDCDAFNLYAYPKDNRIDEAVRMLLTEMKRIDQHGFLQTELDRQKEELLDSYRKSAKEADKTPSTSLADEYTRNFLQGECIPGIRRENSYAKEFVPGITLEEVNAVVADWITDENMIFYLTAPERADLRILTEKEALALINELKDIKTEPWVDNYKETPLYDKVLADVTPKVTKVNSALDYTEYTLPNGIRFVVKKTNYKEDEIRISSFARGGSSLYSDDESFLVNMTASFIDDAGIGEFSATQLDKKLKGKTLSISPTIGSSMQGFSGSCSPKDLETVLQLVNLYYEAPRKDQESFDKNVQAMRTQYRALAAYPQVELQNVMIKTAYPNYKRFIGIPTDADFDKLDLNRMYEVFRERFKDASNQIFFFVGNVADEDVKLIAKYLNNLPCGGEQKNEKDRDVSPRLAPGITHGVAVKGTERMSIVVMVGETEGFEATQRNRRMADMLGECVQISTTEIIREKMGDAYSPYGGVDYSLEPTPSVSWTFQIQCDPKKSDKVEKAALKVLKMYTKKGPDAETLAKAKEQMIKSRETALQENRTWMSIIYGSYYYNEDRDDVITKYNEWVNSITADEIKAFAQKYFDFSHYSVTTLKPENEK